MRLVIGAGILVLLICAVLWGRGTPSSKFEHPLVPRAEGNRQNLILISLDTLRADRLGAYGYSRKTSPHIDQIAAQGAVFENTVSTSCWTLPSHMTMFTGLYPSSHGVTRSKGLKPGEEVQLFAEILERQGYHTKAFTGGGNVGARFGFSRGFETYREDERTENGRKKGFAGSIELVKEFLTDRTQEKPFFLFLHTYDLHCPYNPPDPFFSMFRSPVSVSTDTNRCGGDFFEKGGITPEQASFVSDVYDGGIAWVDKSLGEFFNFLKQQKLLDNTTLVITSDHGEEFLERGRIGHRRNLFKEGVMVPLILHGPGIGPARVNTMVSLVDLFPTLLDILELPIPSQAQGETLLPLLSDPNPPKSLRAFQLSETSRTREMRSRRDNEHHLVTDLTKDKDFLFEQATDPSERLNRAEELPGVVSTKKHELLKVLDSLKRFSTGAREGDSSEDIELLKSLGYL